MKNYADKYLFTSKFFGPNCYQTVFSIGKDQNIYIYDDAEMLVYEEADACTGEFTNYLTGDIIELGDDRAFDYFIEMR